LEDIAESVLNCSGVYEPFGHQFICDCSELSEAVGEKYTSLAETIEAPYVTATLGFVCVSLKATTGACLATRHCKIHDFFPWFRR
jgi:hypothetical protein